MCSSMSRESRFSGLQIPVLVNIDHTHINFKVNIFLKSKQRVVVLLPSLPAVVCGVLCKLACTLVFNQTKKVSLCC